MQWRVSSWAFPSFADRPLAFVAKHGHGHYPKPGTYVRIFGIGTDICDALGPVWRPKPLLIPEDFALRPQWDWLRYMGAWGCAPTTRVYSMG